MRGRDNTLKKIMGGWVDAPGAGGCQVVSESS